MLISSFHLLLHKHCQQRRISGRTVSGGEEERRRRRRRGGRRSSHRREKSSCTEGEFLGEDGGARIRSIAAKRKRKKKTWRVFFRFPKQFERITWCSFAGENVARQQKNVSEMFGVPWKVKASRELVSSEMFKKLNVSLFFVFLTTFYRRVCERKEQKRHEKCRIWI